MSTSTENCFDILSSLFILNSSTGNNTVSGCVEDCCNCHFSSYVVTVLTSSLDMYKAMYRRVCIRRIKEKTLKTNFFFFCVSTLNTAILPVIMKNSKNVIQVNIATGRSLHCQL